MSCIHKQVTCVRAELHVQKQGQERKQVWSNFPHDWTVGRVEDGTYISWATIGLTTSDGKTHFLWSALVEATSGSGTGAADAGDEGAVAVPAAAVPAAAVQPALVQPAPVQASGAALPGAALHGAAVPRAASSPSHSSVEKKKKKTKKVKRKQKERKQEAPAVPQPPMVARRPSKSPSKKKPKPVIQMPESRCDVDPNKCCDFTE